MATRGKGRQEDLLEGVDALRHRIAGMSCRSRFPEKQLRIRADAIVEASKALEHLSNRALDERLESHRKAAANRRLDSPNTVDEGLSALAAAMVRTVGKRPFAVQLMGALALEDDWLIEMRTGEGKTLTAALCAVLRAWRFERCHVVTANDYLAKRDALAYAPFFERCGLRVGYIESESPPEEHKAAYACAITYATGRSLVGDFLRDRLAFSFAAGSRKERIVSLIEPVRAANRILPELRSAIIDEADSVLADDAVTPLIISRAEADPEMLEATRMVSHLVDTYQEGVHYSVEATGQRIVLLAAAVEQLEERLDAFPESWRAAYRVGFLVNKALVARHFFRRNEHYVIVEGKVVVVDEKTGRLMPEVSWSDGLHQAVEAKEGLELTDPTRASTKMSFQSYFRQYPRLSGMSGTLSSLSDEFWRIYELPVARIPTRLPRRHCKQPTLLLADRWAQVEALVAEVVAVHAAGQPVLLGTRSVDDSQELSAALTRAGIAHTVLNALEHEHEAAIVAQAGASGCVTIATNMAGRGTDIHLDEPAISAGGLHVIGSERHESRRVDRQLVGRASRQGEPGSSRFILSLDDRLLVRYLPPRLLTFFRDMLGNALVRLVVLGLYGFLQWMVERQNSNGRIRLLVQEQKVRKALSFAGRR